MGHTKFVSELRIIHVKLEAEYLEKWEEYEENGESST
jgi:hypothetical protein